LNMHKLFHWEQRGIQGSIRSPDRGCGGSRRRPQRQDPLQFLSPGSTKRY
jgi:hypothetical protein